MEIDYVESCVPAKFRKISLHICFQGIARTVARIKVIGCDRCLSKLEIANIMAQYKRSLLKLFSFVRLSNQQEK
jgi:hypothetical protein